MTVDDQMHLALRWSITDVTEDHLISNTMDWQDGKKVRLRLSHLKGFQHFC
jgi:hypothetical protein